MVRSNPGTPRRVPKSRSKAPRDRPNCIKPRRQGFYGKVAWERNKLKSIHTLAKYRTGYRKAWEVPAARRIMKRIGLKKPGTYNKNNQQKGDMFAPNEFKMNDKQAGTIFQACKDSGKLTVSNLKDVKKMLSYAYQLKNNAEGNWPAVKWVWDNTNPDEQKPAAKRKIKPVVVPEPSHLRTAFTREYKPGCGMDFQKWNVALLMSHDLTVFGCRQVEDLKRIKKSKSHTYVPQSGWMATDFHGGRSKIEKKKGIRPWKLYRVCLCPEAKHQRIPDDWETRLDENGNPKESLPWCTSCPLNAFQMIRNLLPADDYRTYPKWLEDPKKFHATWNEGEDVTKDLMQKFFNVQKANPDGIIFDSNSGRKSLSNWCGDYKVPYEESFEIHGDHWTTWRKYYQTKLRSAPDFERRTQSPDPDICTRALWRFARGIGRGRITRDDPDFLNPRQQAQAMLAIMRRLQMHPEIASIVDRGN